MEEPMLINFHFLFLCQASYKNVILVHTKVYLREIGLLYCTALYHIHTRQAGRQASCFVAKSVEKKKIHDIMVT